MTWNSRCKKIHGANHPWPPVLLHGNTSINVLEYASRNTVYVYEQLAIFLYIIFLFKSTKLMLFFFFFLARDMKIIQSLTMKEVLKSVLDTSLPPLWFQPLPCWPALSGHQPASLGCIPTVPHPRPVRWAPLASCPGFRWHLQVGNLRKSCRCL